MVGTSDIIAKGTVTAVQASSDVKVAQTFDVVASGRVTPVQAEARVVVYSGGDRAPYTVFRDYAANGLKVLDDGPGLFVVGGCTLSRKVILINPTAFRQIRIDYETDDLGLPVVDLQTTDEYIFAFLHDVATGQREVLVLTNTIELAEVFRADVTAGDNSGWIAVREDAGVFAYPSANGEVILRRTSGDFEVIDSIRSVAGETATAVWFRYVLDERPETTFKVERIYYLYVLWKSSAKASVIQYQKYTDTGPTSPRVIENAQWWGEVPIADAEAPVRLDNRGNSTVRGASVTNRGPITPTFDGAIQIAPNEWATLWGWNNENDSIADIPAAVSGITRNHFIGSGLPVDAQDILPRLFAPGRNIGAIVLFTDGQEVKWELRGHPAGGVAVTDYTMPPDPDAILAFTGFAVKQTPPTLYRYDSMEPLTIRQIEALRFGKIRLNNAGLGIDQQSIVRHTDEPNDDIPSNARWWPRDTASRIAGGAIQAHADEGRVSRIYADELERELAQGVLFNVPEFNITQEPINFADPSVAQAGEQMGFEVGASADASVIALSAEEYVNPAFPYSRQGRVFVWLRKADGTYENTDVFEAPYLQNPAWTPDANNAYFSRYTEVTPAGDMVFVGSKRGPGIAVFKVDEFGKASYWKTLTWTEYTAMPVGERAHEARFDNTGKLHFLTTAGFSKGSSTTAGTFHVLYSDDNWETFEVRQGGQERPDTTGNTDNLQTLDVSRDGTTFVIGAWEINRLYSFRSDDGWMTYTAHQLAAPPGITQYQDAYAVPGAERISFAISNGCSYDGFRVISASEQTWDYENGVPLANAYGQRTGTAWYWLYEESSDSYSGPYQILPPINIPSPSGNTLFGAPLRMNAPGFRFNCVLKGSGAGLLDAVYLYGIHDGENRKIAELADGFIFESADTRWAWDRDLLVVANKGEDNPDSGEVDVGAFRVIEFSEAP